MQNLFLLDNCWTPDILILSGTQLTISAHAPTKIKYKIWYLVSSYMFQKKVWNSFLYEIKHKNIRKKSPKTLRWLFIDKLIY